MMAGFQQGVEEITIGSGDMILVLSGGSRGFFLGAVRSLSNLRSTAAGEVVEKV